MASALSRIFKTSPKVGFKEHLETDTVDVSVTVTRAQLEADPEMHAALRQLYREAANAPTSTGVDQGTFSPSTVTRQIAAQAQAKHNAMMQQAMQNMGMGASQMGGGLGAGPSATPGQYAAAAVSNQSTTTATPSSQSSFGNVGPVRDDAPPVKTSVTQAIKQDLDKQTKAHGHFGDKTEIDTTRLARVALRAVRSIDSAVFVAAGVKPKHRQEDFIKVVDQIMRSL
ncbi:MAG: hypothetical protein H8E94_09480 [Alphaproteobacteria bacterium]|nr:hypothetical protein [Alphaproteobacteria bacterium]